MFPHGHLFPPFSMSRWFVMRKHVDGSNEARKYRKSFFLQSGSRLNPAEDGIRFIYRSLIPVLPLFLFSRGKKDGKVLSHETLGWVEVLVMDGRVVTIGSYGRIFVGGLLLLLHQEVIGAKNLFTTLTHEAERGTSSSVPSHGFYHRCKHFRNSK